MNRKNHWIKKQAYECPDCKIIQVHDQYWQKRIENKDSPKEYQFEYETMVNKVRCTSCDKQLDGNCIEDNKI